MHAREQGLIEKHLGFSEALCLIFGGRAACRLLSQHLERGEIVGHPPLTIHFGAPRGQEVESRHEVSRFEKLARLYETKKLARETRETPLKGRIFFRSVSQMELNAMTSPAPLGACNDAGIAVQQELLESNGA
jgi:hypothetical protein